MRCWHWSAISIIAEKKVWLISRPGSVQTDLVLANRAIDRNSPDYLAFSVMNQVLGPGPAARLFRIIREGKGYTYGVSSSFAATRYTQDFGSSMSVRTEVTEAVLADLLKEFHEIRDVAVPKDELDGAKRTLVGASRSGCLRITGTRIRTRSWRLPPRTCSGWRRSKCRTTTCRSATERRFANC